MDLEHVVYEVKDHVAHMIGTESMLAGRPRPSVPDAVVKAPHVKNEIGAANEAWVESFRGRPPADTRRGPGPRAIRRRRRPRRTGSD